MVAWTPAPPRTSFASLSEHFAAESDGEGGKLGQEDAVKEVSDANNNVDSDRQEFCQQMLDQDQDQLTVRSKSSIQDDDNQLISDAEEDDRNSN